MRIASQCQERALLLLQIAQECPPQFRPQVVHIAREWLNIAAVRISCLGLIERIEKEDRDD